MEHSSYESSGLIKCVHKDDNLFVRYNLNTIKSYQR